MKNQSTGRTVIVPYHSKAMKKRFGAGNIKAGRVKIKSCLKENGGITYGKIILSGTFSQGGIIQKGNIMKNAIIALIGIAMVIMVTVGINTVENKTMRQNELDSNLDKALERTMEILTIDPVYQISKNDTEVAADFIENFLVNTTSDATFKIDIITVDPEKGLLDVQVSESYYRKI